MKIKDTLLFCTAPLWRMGMLCVFFWLLANMASAQDSGKRGYMKSSYQEKETSAASWSKAVEGLDYSPRKKKKEEDIETHNDDYNDPDLDFLDNGSLFNGDWSNIFKVLFFLLVIGALVFLILRIMGGTAFLTNKKVEKDIINYSIETVEADIHKSDIEGFAQHALNEKDYKLAIRLYYLQVLKILSQNKLIKWKRNKTNNEYIREMRQNAHFKDFRQTTRLFEQAWYGDVTIEEQDFERIKPGFVNLIAALDEKK